MIRGAALLAAAAAGMLLAIAFGLAGNSAESETASGPPVVTDNLRELNHKLAREIAKLDGLKVGGFDAEQVGRTLNDLEVTKLRALDGFPDVFGLPYSETFKQLSCIDERISEGQLILLQLSQGRLHVGPASFGTPRGYAHLILKRFLREAKACKDTLEVQLGVGTGTTSPPTTTAPTTTSKPTTHAYRGPIDNGTYLAAGSGSHIKLTVEGRNVQILFGVSFQTVCAGPATHATAGRSPVYDTFDFHPGGTMHAISSTGAFRFTVFQSELDGQFTGTSTVRGIFDLNPGAGSECRGDHNWTATLNGRPPAAIQPTPLPVLFRTRGYWWVQQALLPADFTRKTSDADAAVNSQTGESAAWDVGKGRWYDTTTGKSLSVALGSVSGWSKPGRAYRLMQQGALPRGFIVSASDRDRAHNAASGANAAWNDSKQEWLDAKSSSALTLSGLSVPAAAPAKQHPGEAWQVSGASRSHNDPFNLCIYIKGPAGQTGTVSTKAGSPEFESQVPLQQKSFRLNATGLAEVLFTEPPAANDGPNLIAFTIARHESDGSISTSGTQWGDTYQRPPWGLPACTPPG